MLLDELAVTSRRVTQERGRLAKIRLLGECLKRMRPEEIAIGVAYLSGELPQRKLGVGWAKLREARPETAAAEPALTLLELDAALARVQAESGRGSSARRLEALRELFRRATESEQEFLARLLIGELRQGALEGLMADAIAHAASVAASDVRRALMLCGNAGEVASAALTGGAAELARFRLELMRPIQPMLAQSAAGPAEAIAALERAQLSQPALPGRACAPLRARQALSLRQERGRGRYDRAPARNPRPSIGVTATELRLISRARRTSLRARDSAASARHASLPGRPAR
jgi:DNA ligase 1